MPPVEPAIDTRAIVADIEAEVARRRAAGEYPEALLERLAAEFRIVRDDEPVEALAYIQTHRGPVNRLPVVGRGIVFSKRMIRRAVAWYVQPIALQQTSFNLAAVRELRALQRRVERLEVPWQRPPSAPAVGGLSDATVGRVHAIAATLASTTARALVLPGLITAPEARLVEHAPELAARLVVIDDDPVLALRTRSSASIGAVVMPGTLVMVPPADLLELVALAASRLVIGGTLVIDAPQPPTASAWTDPSVVDPAAVRWLDPTTVTLLCEAAGLTVTAPAVVADGWYGLTAVRNTR